MFESLKKFFGGGKTDTAKAIEITDGETETEAKNRRAMSESRLRIAEAEKEIVRLKTEMFKEKIIPQAKAFALEAVKSGKAYSAEMSGLKEQFVQAAIDDLTIPLADGAKRVETVKAMVSNRKPHNFDKEFLGGNHSGHKITPITGS